MRKNIGQSLWEYLFATIIFVVIILGPLLLNGLWFDSNVDYVVSQYKGYPVDVPWYLTVLPSFFLFPITLLANVIMSILIYLN